VYLKNKMNIFI